jgi:hypothetical protein
MLINKFEVIAYSGTKRKREGETERGGGQRDGFIVDWLNR